MYIKRLLDRKFIRLFQNANSFSSQNLEVDDTKISTVKIQALREHIQTVGNFSHREIYKKYISYKYRTYKTKNINTVPSKKLLL